MSTYPERLDERFSQETKTALKNIEELLQLPQPERYFTAYNILQSYLEALLVNFAEGFTKQQLGEIRIVLDQLASLTGIDEHLSEATKAKLDQLAKAQGEREAFYKKTDEKALLGPYQIAAGVVQHPDTGFWQVWISTNGYDFKQIAVFNEERKALNAISLIKLEAQSGTFYDEELVTDFYLFLKEQSNGRTLPLPNYLVQKLGLDILHTVIDMPQIDNL